jgi:N-acyl-D-amino-acid deacylase
LIVPTSTPLPTATVSIPEGYLDSAIPISGGYVAELEILDKTLLGFIQERNIGAAQLVVIKDGVVILNHAYGWYDVEHTRPFTTNGVMRIASITKPITLAAIRNLLEEDKLSATQKVFCLEGSPADCLLNIEPMPGATIDPKLKDITVIQLIDHKGGWDRAASFDPMFASIKIARALNVQSPPDKYQIAQYMLGQPLDFKPGSKEVYSNFGYSLLGQVIEKVSGKTYMQYIQEDLLAPLGVTDVYLGDSLLENRQPDEPYYTCTGKAENVFNPGSQVCWPDGGWSIQGMDAHGGLVISANSLGTFLNAYCINGKPVSAPGSCGNELSFFGSLDGTLSLAVQRPDGINYVVILNNRWDKKNGDYDDVKKVVDTALKLIQ